MRIRKLAATAAIAIAALGFGSSANAVPVDLEMSLVIDVSGSVSTTEYNLMMDGYANAFRNATIQNNILSTSNGNLGKIAVNVVFFSGSAFTTSFDTFRLLDSTTTIGLFADALDSFARPGSGGTTIASGMNKATPLFASNGFEGTKLIMDVSGDGTSGAADTQAARNAAAAAGITVNGITIGTTSINTFYASNVITADGFALHATDFDGFSSGILQKLAIETGGGDVPIPGTLFLIGAGLLALGASRRRTKV